MSTEENCEVIGKTEGPLLPDFYEVSRENRRKKSSLLKNDIAEEEGKNQESATSLLSTTNKNLSFCW